LIWAEAGSVSPVPKPTAPSDMSRVGFTGFGTGALRLRLLGSLGFAGEAHFELVQLLLQLGYDLVIVLGGRRGLPGGQGALPGGHRLVEASGLEIEVAEVVVDGGGA